MAARNFLIECRDCATDPVPSASIRRYESEVRPIPGTGPTELFSMATQGKERDSVTSEEEARAALVARLARIQHHPTRLKSNPSMQPTPEAAKSRVTRLRQKRRILLQKSKRAAS
jgi:hypothetical protein